MSTHCYIHIHEYTLLYTYTLAYKQYVIITEQGETNIIKHVMYVGQYNV